VHRDLKNDLKDLYKNPGPTQFFMEDLTREDQMNKTLEFECQDKNKKV